MKSKRGTIVTVAAICFIFLTILGFTLLSQRVEFNEDSVTGNTAGNLNNGGLFCEKEGVVYFSNPYDEGRLYSMTPEETRLKKLTSSKATSINADSHYLYYYMDSGAEDEKLSYMHFHGIYRSKLGGQDTQCLKRNYAITLQLCGNYIYYQSFDNNNENGTELYKIKIDKSEDVRIADYNINPACCENGLIYFNGTKDNHYLYTLNTKNDSISVVWNGNIWNPVYEEGYIYYMDVSHDYRLCRYSLSAKTEEVLTEDRIDFFNIYGGSIYYQKSSQSEPALKRMQTDGSNVEIVAEGIYKNINITSNYVYFTAFGCEVPVYKTPTAGAVSVTTFDSAMEAALAESD